MRSRTSAVASSRPARPSPPWNVSSDASLNCPEFPIDPPRRARYHPARPVRRPFGGTMGWLDRLKEGLRRTREALAGAGGDLLGDAPPATAESLEELEEALIAVDLGP